MIKYFVPLYLAFFNKFCGYPSQADVYHAVDSHFGTDEQRMKSCQQLEAWGNKALLQIQKMALEYQETEHWDSIRAWKTVASIETLNTWEAIGFLIDLAAGRTNIATDEAISSIASIIDDDDDEEIEYFKEHSEFKEIDFYAHEIEVFPDEQGHLAIIAVGSGVNSTPTIVRYDQNLNPVWQATLSHRIRKLSMLEYPDKKRLYHFIISDEMGCVFIFSENGLLLFQEKLPEIIAKQGKVDRAESIEYDSIDHIKTGLFENNQLGISIDMGNSILLFDVTLL